MGRVLAGREDGGKGKWERDQEGCRSRDLPFAAILDPQRFGSALVPTGNLQLKKKQYEKDFGPIDPECTCPTCKK